MSESLVLTIAIVSVLVSHTMTWIAIAQSRRVLEECLNVLDGFSEDENEESKTAADDLQDRLIHLQKLRFSGSRTHKG